MPQTEVINELARINAMNGVLRASDVVEEARPVGSPLHHCFEWDDVEAADKWRLQQARQLIRYVVEMLPYDAPKFEVRAYVSLTPDRVEKRGGYRVMAEVLTSPSGRSQLLADALAELNRLKVKYYQLTELDGIFRAIERAQRNYGVPPDDQPNGDSATT